MEFQRGRIDLPQTIIVGVKNPLREVNWITRQLDEASDAFKLHALVDSLNAYELAIALEYCKRLRSARQK